MYSKKKVKRKSIRKGEYRHYKGSRVTVLGIAYHSETLEPYVVYRHHEGKKDLWVRPHAMFVEKIRVAGKITPRFRLIRKK